MAGEYASGREQTEPEVGEATFQDETRPEGRNWKTSDKRCNVESKQSSFWTLYVSWGFHTACWIVHTPAGTK